MKETKEKLVGIKVETHFALGLIENGMPIFRQQARILTT